jgi:single-strand DNA-binding protein
VAGSYNHIVLVGRLVADPELRQTQDGTPVTSFRIAVNRPKGRSGQEQTDFFGVSVWRQRAEVAAKYLQKGKPVLVAGRLQIREYTDRDGNKRTAVEVTADDFQFMDSRPAGDNGGGGGSRTPAPAAAQSGDLPEYEFQGDADEEVPF